jgi:hypothetical protein
MHAGIPDPHRGVESWKAWVERTGRDFARFAAAEDFASIDRVDDAKHYRRLYKERDYGSLDEHYAAEFARRLNERFGDQPVEPFDIPGLLATEYRPADAEPGSGLLAWPWKRRPRNPSVSAIRLSRSGRKQDDEGHARRRLKQMRE